MPDPMGIALGVISVAETGAKLADTIYTYINSVRRAEEQFRPIADYVKVTCTVLEQIGSHLQDEDLTELYKPALLASAQKAIQGCERAFEGLSTYLTALTKDGGGNERSISTKTKFAWNWKRKELDNHQVHLERYKSTFDVILSALTFVSSSRTAKNTLEMKIELKRLMKVEAEAKIKEAMLPPVEPSEPTLSLLNPLAPENGSAAAINHQQERDVVTALINNSATAARQAHDDATSPDIIDQSIANATGVENEETEAHDALLARLNECALAMEKLSTTLKHTISQWEHSRNYHRESLLPDFQLLHSAIERVSAVELLDTRISRHSRKAEPICAGLPWFSELRVASRNTIQVSRFHHFKFEPVSPPGSRAASPAESGATTPVVPDAVSGPPVHSHAKSSPALTPTASVNREDQHRRPIDTPMPQSAKTNAEVEAPWVSDEIKLEKVSEAEKVKKVDRAFRRQLADAESRIASQRRLHEQTILELQRMEAENQASHKAEIHAWRRTEEMRRMQEIHELQRMEEMLEREQQETVRNLQRKQKEVQRRHDEQILELLRREDKMQEKRHQEMNELQRREPKRQENLKATANLAIEALYSGGTTGDIDVNILKLSQLPADGAKLQLLEVQQEPLVVDTTEGAPPRQAQQVLGNADSGSIKPDEKGDRSQSRPKFPLPDYYKDLGISTSASVDDIRKAYRQLALQWHPDRNPGREPEVAAEFEAIRQAHEILGDPVRRRRYDNQRNYASRDQNVTVTVREYGPTTQRMPSKTNTPVEVDNKKATVVPPGAPRRHDSGRDRSMLCSRSRSRSRSKPQKWRSGWAVFRGVGAFGNKLASHEKTKDTSIRPSCDSRKRSRSRSRTYSTASTDKVYRDAGRQNSRVARATGGRSPAVAARVIEGRRYRSRENRDESDFRPYHEDAPITAAGLGGASLAGLYDINGTDGKAEQDAMNDYLDQRRRRRRDHESEEEFEAFSDLTMRSDMTKVAGMDYYGDGDERIYSCGETAGRGYRPPSSQISYGGSFVGQDRDEEPGHYRRRGNSAGSSPDRRYARRSRSRNRKWKAAGAAAELAEATRLHAAARADSDAGKDDFTLDEDFHEEAMDVEKPLHPDVPDLADVDALLRRWTLVEV